MRGKKKEDGVPGGRKINWGTTTHSTVAGGAKEKSREQERDHTVVLEILVDNIGQAFSPSPHPVAPSRPPPDDSVARHACHANLVQKKWVPSQLGLHREDASRGHGLFGGSAVSSGPGSPLVVELAADARPVA